jgi:hypothetical protein
MFSFNALGRIAMVSIALAVSSPLIASADDDVAKPVAGTPIAYENVKSDNPEVKKVWEGWGDGYLSEDDDMRVIWLGHVTDSKGRAVTISQIGSLRVCGATSCPVRVVIGKELVNEGSYCDSQDYHVLVPSKGAVFFCDIAVPLETAADKASAGRK